MGTEFRTGAANLVAGRPASGLRRGVADADRPAQPGRGAELAEDPRSAPAHSPVVTPAAAQRTVAGMRFSSVPAARTSSARAARTSSARAGSASRSRRHACTASAAAASTPGSTRWIAVSRSPGQRVRACAREGVDPDDDLVARLDPLAASGVARGDELALEEAGLDRGDRPAQLGDPVHERLGARDDLGDLGLDDDGPGEEVVVLEQVALVGEHLLHPQGPLLVHGGTQPAAKRREAHSIGQQLTIRPAFTGHAAKFHHPERLAAYRGVPA